MAVEAPFLHRKVLKFNVLCRIAHILVATEAKLVSCSKEVKFILGRVRVVTFDAVTFRHDLVGAYCVLGNYAGMTGETDLVRIRCQQLPMRRIMGIMASRTFPVLYGCMDGRHLELIPEVDMAGQAVFTTSARLQPEFIVLLLLREGRIHHGENAQHRDQQEQTRAFVNTVFFHRFSPI